MHVPTHDVIVDPLAATDLEIVGYFQQPLSELRREAERGRGRDFSLGYDIETNGAQLFCALMYCPVERLTFIAAEKV